MKRIKCKKADSIAVSEAFERLVNNKIIDIKYNDNSQYFKNKKYIYMANYDKKSMQPAYFKRKIFII